MDGRTISVPLEWYPRLAGATPYQLENWKLCAAGYGILWPDLDEDLSTEGMLRGCAGTGNANGGPNIGLQATAGLRRFSQAAPALFPAAPEPWRSAAAILTSGR
jgi:hypothetical protein